MRPVLKTGKPVDPLFRVTTDYAPNYNAINLSNSTIAGSNSVIFDESTTQQNGASDLVSLKD